MQGVQDLLDPLKPSLEPLLGSLRSIMEANQARRRPKVAKGARDLVPAQMMVVKQPSVPSPASSPAMVL